jgi:hypothetical protein
MFWRGVRPAVWALACAVRGASGGRAGPSLAALACALLGGAGARAAFPCTRPEQCASPPARPPPAIACYYLLTGKCGCGAGWGVLVLGAGEGAVLHVGGCCRSVWSTTTRPAPWEVRAGGTLVRLVCPRPASTPPLPVAFLCHCPAALPRGGCAPRVERSVVPCIEVCCCLAAFPCPSSKHAEPVRCR